MCKHGLMRVLIVYGSETGCSEGAVKKLAKKWSASKSANKFKICDTLSGDTAADRFGTKRLYMLAVTLFTAGFTLLLSALSFMHIMNTALHRAGANAGNASFLQNGGGVHAAESSTKTKLMPTKMYTIGSE